MLGSVLLEVELKEQQKCVLGLLLESTYGQAYWTPEITAQAILGITFAALHQPRTVLSFVLYELCRRDQYVDLLRDELQSLGSQSWETLDAAPLLNSFIKETMRCLPPDKSTPLCENISTRPLTFLIVAIRRQALQPFKFSDNGPLVPKGAVACTSAYNLMRCDDRYPDGDVFDGHRFMPGASHLRIPEMNQAEYLKMTEVSDRFVTWGYGSLAW